MPTELYRPNRQPFWIWWARTQLACQLASAATGIVHAAIFLRRHRFPADWLWRIVRALAAVASWIVPTPRAE
jgi:hypothetical protein